MGFFDISIISLHRGGRCGTTHKSKDKEIQDDVN